MGFLVYHREGQREAMNYTLVRRISIVGQTGALSQWLRANATAGSPFKWELSGPRLVAALAPDLDAASHCIVMDMMPERLAGASLCHVLTLAGQSDSTETDMVIMMREMSLVDLPRYGTDIRRQFRCDVSASGSELVESMGISGGLKGGTYRWCPPKMNIGAAVFHAKTPRPESAAI